MDTLIEMDSGLVSMLKLNKYNELRTMYTLFGRLAEGHPAMRRVVQEHLKTVGMAIVGEAESSAKSAAGAAAAANGAAANDPHSTFVDALLALRDEADQWLNRAFQNDKRFHSA